MGLIIRILVLLRTMRLFVIRMRSVDLDALRGVLVCRRLRMSGSREYRVTKLGLF